MAIVIDANILTAFVVKHELSQIAQKFRHQTGVVLPSIAFVETANAVRKYVRLGRANLQQLLDVKMFLSGYASEIISDTDLLVDASQLAIELEHSIYDCLYLALARTRSCKLVTADKRMANISKSIAIPTQLLTATP